jgi:alkylhydroperoxidase family enzyme
MLDPSRGPSIAPRRRVDFCRNHYVKEPTMPKPRWSFLLVFAAFAAGPAWAAPDGTGSWPLASNEEAWKLLPESANHEGLQLPSWARATARDLPRTTAAMLDLDRLHRTRSPLGPVLRGKMRWIAADANRCEYTRATAEADLRREGVSDAEIADLKAGLARWPKDDRDALSFALQMTADASLVTDDQVLDLTANYGKEKVVAMVLLLAAANFQDRLILGLGLPPEEGGALPPLEVTFDKTAKPPVPERANPADLHGPDEPVKVSDPAWKEFDFEALQKGLAVQKANLGRIPVPTYEEVLARLPEGAPKPKNPVRIKWSLVCMGYQPVLASAWSACTTAFREEAKQDRVFEESLFWIVTRTIHCFY